MYIVDIQDPAEHWEADINEVRQFLYNLWDSSDEEAGFNVQEYLDRIAVAPIQELNEYLGGCDYTLAHSEEELKELIETLSN